MHLILALIIKKTGIIWLLEVYVLKIYEKSDYMCPLLGVLGYMWEQSISKPNMA